MLKPSVQFIGALKPWGIDMITDTQKKALEAPLDPAVVVKPTGQFGPKGDYIEGWHAINEANRIFGFDAWSYTTELQKVCEATNEKGNIEISYICKCTVEALGTTRQDIGYGSGAAKKAGDAHEGAVKEAVTDALKRCLRTFGNPFGLALYDKSRANVSAPPPPAIDQTQRGIITDLAAAAEVNILTILESYDAKSIDELTAGQAAKIIKRLNLTIDKATQQKELENA